MLSSTHIAQKPDHSFRPVDTHQYDFIAEQNLQGHKHQDLTGAADHLVPHPKNKQRAQLIWAVWRTEGIQKVSSSVENKLAQEGYVFNFWRLVQNVFDHSNIVLTNKSRHWTLSRHLYSAANDFSLVIKTICLFLLLCPKLHVWMQLQSSPECRIRLSGGNTQIIYLSMPREEFLRWTWWRQCLICKEVLANESMQFKERFLKTP